MKKINLLLLTLAIGVVACQNTSKLMTDSHTSEQALDWDGVYKGTLPCADCSGIETTVKLNQNKTFKKIDKYLDKANSTFTQTGTFIFTDKATKIILIDKSQNKTQYAIGENHLILLDKDGKESTSPLANQYRLNKIQ